MTYLDIYHYFCMKHFQELHAAQYIKNILIHNYIWHRYDIKECTYKRKGNEKLESVLRRVI